MKLKTLQNKALKWGCLTPTVAALLMCSLVSPSQAGPEDIVKLLLKSFPVQTPSDLPSSTKARVFPTPGVRQIADRISELPVDLRPTDSEIANAYYFKMSELGYTDSLWLSCSACIPERPVLDDQGSRSVKVLLESDNLLSGEAAGHSSWGALESFSPGTGKKINAPVGSELSQRASAISALADALSDLRGQPLSEDEFREALVKNLELLGSGTQNVSRFGLEKISYDAADETLSFEAKIRGVNIEIAKLDISKYMDRLVGLVFGAGGVFVLQNDNQAGTSKSEELAEAKRKHVERLIDDWNKCAEQTSVECFQRRDTGTSEKIYEAVWAEAILEKAKELR